MGRTLEDLGKAKLLDASIASRASRFLDGEQNCGMAGISGAIAAGNEGLNGHDSANILELRGASAIRHVLGFCKRPIAGSRRTLS